MNLHPILIAGIPFLLFALFSICTAEVFYLTAPTAFRLNSAETIAVISEHKNGAQVTAYVQDYPGKIKNISRSVFPIESGKPKLFTVDLNPLNFPPNFFSSTSEKFVSLTVHSDEFHKELKIPISSKVGHVFIQMDKPIYTPLQRAHIRIITLNEDALPTNQPFNLQIKNPQGIIVHEKAFGGRLFQKEFFSYDFTIPKYALDGYWRAVVNYGYQLQQNSSVEFTVEDYVLPTFTVQLTTPDFILEREKVFYITARARYVYNKPVTGIVTFKIGLQKDSPIATYFIRSGPFDLVADGSYTLEIEHQAFIRHNNVGRFPEDANLVVEAEVMDLATGKKESARSNKSRFSKTPYVITFPQSLLDFKPGLVSIIEADIKFFDGRPAPRVPTDLEARSDGKVLKTSILEPISNKEGKVLYWVHTLSSHSTIEIKLTTNDPKYIGSQAEGRLLQQKFQSASYIAIDKTNAQKHKVGGRFQTEVHFEPMDMQNTTYFTVSSKGKIILQSPLKDGQFKVNRVEFLITYKMVPNFRVTVFTHHNKKLLMDTMNVEVEDTCSGDSQVTIDARSEQTPGSIASLNLNGPQSALIGLLGVDQAVYAAAASKKDVLERSQVLQTLAKHDLGCGPGGGISTDVVMANAGLMVASTHHTPSLEATTCVAIKRRKRSLTDEILNNYVGLSKRCCSLGMNYDIHNRSCEERTHIVVQHLKGAHQDCFRAFAECCIIAEEMGIKPSPESKTNINVGANDFEPIFVDDDNFHEGLTVRQDFRETWFEDLVLGLDGKREFNISLPHSITTWVVQAVSVSRHYGICIAEPKEIVAFQRIFLQFDLPRAVVRNEQIEIEATLFNYDNDEIAATFYLYGVEGICTGAHKGEKSERKRMLIKPQSAGTVTFPIIPLKEGMHSLRMVALTSKGSDVVLKKLNVIPEGVTKNVTIPLQLDPSNQQRRRKRSNNNEIPGVIVTDFVNSAEQKQQTVVTISLPKDLVPGTESCKIVAIGNLLGPALETAVKDPASLISMPTGCGEQTMMRLAPTLYAMRYLKETGKVTAEIEKNGYDYIRDGYRNMLGFRKDDGSFATFANKPTSTWLTSFVVKVFCQANDLVHIDSDVVCGGVKWLINNQQPDGSYSENNFGYHGDLLGGVKGKTPMTAYVLVALEECNCETEELIIAKARAASYLEQHLADAEGPLASAIVAYALSLTNSASKQAANDRLKALAKIDEDNNMMHWGMEGSAKDIEATGYALLTQLLFNDFKVSNSIVNWLNTQQLESGQYRSTQDTVVALQALSEYAMRAKMPSINLKTDVTSDDERNFHHTFNFDERNAHILQETKQNFKINGKLIFNTAGYGVGSLFVNLKYNVFPSKDTKSKFNVTVNALKMNVNGAQMFMRGRSKTIAAGIQEVLEKDVKADYDADYLVEEDDTQSQKMTSYVDDPQEILDKLKSRVKRSDDNNVDQNKETVKILVCSKYSDTKSPQMSIIDVGLFSGYEANEDDLVELKRSGELIQKYEKYSKGIIFYLETVPTDKFYCFDFHATQEFNVGKTQVSKVEIYDYYNPVEKFTTFYARDESTAFLHTLCDKGQVCKCAEGGCPTEESLYVDRWNELSIDDKMEKLLLKACEEYEFVWKGKLSSPIEQKYGYYNYTFKVEDVIKEGTEKADLIIGEDKRFLSRDNCNLAFLRPGETYLIMGMDGQLLTDEEGKKWYRYILDRKSVVHQWTLIKEANDRTLQKALSRAMTKLKAEGCSA